jgi:hypothetical protein
MCWQRGAALALQCGRDRVGVEPYPLLSGVTGINILPWVTDEYQLNKGLTRKYRLGKQLGLAESMYF